jgi:ferrochelatase
LKAEGFNVKAYIAMRYWHPFTHDALERAVRDGVEYLITVPLYPQFSYTTTGSSVNELKKVMKNHKINLPLLEMPAYYDHPGYQAAFVDTIREVMDNTSWTCPKEKVTILFSAHSLPESHVKKTGDPYPQHIDETIRLVMSHAFPQNPWRLSFQSKVGPIPWLSPSTEEVIEEMAKEGIKDVAVVPISFVSEHLETLYEIDILYGELAQEVGITNFKRAQTVNTHPQYIAALADLVKQQIQQHIPDNHKGVAVASH